MSLATLRTHVWKGGNDIVLHYKSNGRKVIQLAPPPSAEPAQETEAPQESPVTPGNANQAIPGQAL